MTATLDYASLTAVIMDMDGVLWHGDHALPGMQELFARLRASRLKFALATNNATRVAAEYVTKLERMGVAGVSDEQIVTSGMVTTHYLQTHYPAGAALHVLGSDALRKLVTEAGFALADEGVQAVVVGLDLHLTYDKLKRASLLIQAGANFVATNEDPSLPTPEGLIPGAGTMVSAMRTATGREPVVMGKPNRFMYELALERLGVTASTSLMIGDRLDTDIIGAVHMGMKTAMVLTGAMTQADVDASPVKPDVVYPGLPELLRAWG